MRDPYGFKRGAVLFMLKTGWGGFGFLLNLTEGRCTLRHLPLETGPLAGLYSHGNTMNDAFHLKASGGSLEYKHRFAEVV